jgi:hypothetical protein
MKNLLFVLLIILLSKSALSLRKAQLSTSNQVVVKGMSESSLSEIDDEGTPVPVVEHVEESEELVEEQFAEGTPLGSPHLNEQTHDD